MKVFRLRLNTGQDVLVVPATNDGAFALDCTPTGAYASIMGSTGVTTTTGTFTERLVDNVRRAAAAHAKVTEALGASEATTKKLMADREATSKALQEAQMDLMRHAGVTPGMRW